MPRKAKIAADTDVYTFSYLFIASQEMLIRAKEDEGGRFYSCMATQLFSAFCLEAYLNHLGAEIFPFWGDIERKLGPSEKLQLISHQIGLRPNFGTRPFQSFKEIFQLRNSLAHGKTEHVKEENEQILYEEDPKLPTAKWKTMINLDMAIKFNDDVLAIIDTIHKKSGSKHHPLYTPEASRWSEQIIE